MSAPASQKPARWRTIARRVVPYLIATVAIVMVLRKYPPSAIAGEMERGNALAMAPWAVALLATSIVQVASADWLVMRGVTGLPPFWVALRGKAGAALLNVVGYAFQVGGYGVWIARVTGMRVGLASGVVLYILSSELVALFTITSLAIWVGGAEVSPGLRIAAPIVAAVLALLKLAGAGRDAAKLPQPFQPWRLMKLRHTVAQLVLRVAHIASLCFFTWGAANAFGLPVPLGAMFSYFPLILLVGAMPVNVAGFGAVQAVWLLLAPWAPGGGEQVIAFSVVWHLLLAAGILLRGLPFVRRIALEIDEGKRDAAALSQRSTG